MVMVHNMLLYINQSNNRSCLNSILKEQKKNSFLLILDDITMGEELAKIMKVNVNFYGKAKAKKC